MFLFSEITRAYTRFYRDTGQLVAIVEWSDGTRTEGPASATRDPTGLHMWALFSRAKDKGVKIEHEVW